MNFQTDTQKTTEILQNGKNLTATNSSEKDVLENNITVNAPSTNVPCVDETKFFEGFDNGKESRNNTNVVIIPEKAASNRNECCDDFFSGNKMLDVGASMLLAKQNFRYDDWSNHNFYQDDATRRGSNTTFCSNDDGLNLASNPELVKTRDNDNNVLIVLGEEAIIRNESKRNSTKRKVSEAILCLKQNGNLNKRNKLNVDEPQSEILPSDNLCALSGEEAIIRNESIRNSTKRKASEEILCLKQNGNLKKRKNLKVRSVDDLSDVGEPQSEVLRSDNLCALTLDNEVDCIVKDGCVKNTLDCDFQPSGVAEASLKDKTISEITFNLQTEKIKGMLDDKSSEFSFVSRISTQGSNILNEFTEEKSIPLTALMDRCFDDNPTTGGLLNDLALSPEDKGSLKETSADDNPTTGDILDGLALSSEDEDNSKEKVIITEHAPCDSYVQYSSIFDPESSSVPTPGENYPLEKDKENSKEDFSPKIRKERKFSSESSSDDDDSSSDDDEGSKVSESDDNSISSSSDSEHTVVKNPEEFNAPQYHNNDINNSKEDCDFKMEQEKNNLTENSVMRIKGKSVNVNRGNIAEIDEGRLKETSADDKPTTGDTLYDFALSSEDEDNSKEKGSITEHAPHDSYVQYSSILDPESNSVPTPGENCPLKKVKENSKEDFSPKIRKERKFSSESSSDDDDSSSDDDEGSNGSESDDNSSSSSSDSEHTVVKNPEEFNAPKHHNNDINNSKEDCDFELEQEKNNLIENSVMRIKGKSTNVNRRNIAEIHEGSLKETSADDKLTTGDILDDLALSSEDEDNSKEKGIITEHAPRDSYAQYSSILDPESNSVPNLSENYPLKKDKENSKGDFNRKIRQERKFSFSSSESSSDDDEGSKESESDDSSSSSSSDSEHLTTVKNPKEFNAPQYHNNDINNSKGGCDFKIEQGKNNLTENSVMSIKGKSANANRRNIAGIVKTDEQFPSNSAESEIGKNRINTIKNCPFPVREDKEKPKKTGRKRKSSLDLLSMDPKEKEKREKRNVYAARSREKKRKMTQFYEELLKKIEAEIRKYDKKIGHYKKKEHTNISGGHFQKNSTF